jgi:hypothetical protein
MYVWGQYITVDLDKKGSMFDFMVSFFIPENSYSSVEAFYIFDKKSKAQKSDNGDAIEGADNATYNEKRHFKFNELTGAGLGISVAAQVKLQSSDADGFTITVTLKKDKSHSVAVTYKGKPPSWLGSNIFDGTLMLVGVKDLAPVRP